MPRVVKRKVRNPTMKTVKVIGAGLAGCEAAWQLAVRGINVELYDTKPKSFTPAHHSENFAELVCSNSLRAAGVENAVGLLKEELRIFGSLIIACADATSVPAGGALAVDRQAFSQMVTDKIKGHKLIHFVSQHVEKIPDDDICVIATGPLTLPPLSEDIIKRFGDNLSFFDAAAPIVAFDSIDMDKAYFASRYGKGTADYINCPMTREEYLFFRDELNNAECAQLKDFENNRVFEGCMPIEVMAARGEDTMRYGPLKPVGLTDPKTGKTPYAVVQLRKDNAAGTLYNIVGFQTHLKFPEQKRVFSLIPSLENAEFYRYGVMHRNMFLNSPKLLNCFYEVRNKPGLFFAGQMTGVEGYVESTSSGLVAGISAAYRFFDMPAEIFPDTTAIGALCNYVSCEGIEDFQPMNVNFGIISQSGCNERRKKERRIGVVQNAIATAEKLAAAVSEKTFLPNIEG